MKRFFLALIIGVSFAITPAAGKLDPITKPLEPDFSSMRFLLGTWWCARLQTSQRFADRITQHYFIDASGHFLVKSEVYHDERRSMNRRSAMSLISYEQDVKQWALIYFGNFGGYGLETSPGWKGGTLVWRTIVPHLNVPPELTLTKISDTRYTGKLRLNTSGYTGETSCVKVPERLPRNQQQYYDSHHP